MGHSTGVRVHQLISDQYDDSILDADSLFEFDFRDRYLQNQLDGDIADEHHTALVINRELPHKVRGLSVRDISVCGGYWQWGWCRPSELKKLWMKGDLDDWVCGLLRVAAALNDRDHLIEIYDAG